MKFLLLPLLIFAGQAWAGLTPDDVVKRADGVKMPDDSIGFVATVKDFKNSDLVKETRYQVMAKGHDSSLITTTFPERQVGRKLLMDHDSMWIYTPDIKRPTRVSMQQKLTGEIANGDIARTDFSGDYKASFIDSVNIDGREAYHLKLTAKRSGVTYVRIEYWVAKNDFLPIKAIFYAVSGKPLKTGVYAGVKNVMGHRCVTEMHVEDALDHSRRSVLIYSHHKHIQISDRMLAKESLND